MRIVWIVLLAVSLYGAMHAWQDRAFVPPDGILAPDPPTQVMLEQPVQFDARGVTMRERAKYDLRVRLLRKERYRLDGGSTIAPWDLAVGWGPMSDTRVLDDLEISQMGRFFYWRMRNRTAPLSARDLTVSAGQIHAIPANEQVETELSRIRRGQVIELHGYLVDVARADGFRWSTSLTREDTGDGACEIMWIEAIDVP